MATATLEPRVTSENSELVQLEAVPLSDEVRGVRAQSCCNFWCCTESTSGGPIPTF